MEEQKGSRGVDVMGVQIYAPNALPRERDSVPTLEQTGWNPERIYSNMEKRKILWPYGV